MEPIELVSVVKSIARLSAELVAGPAIRLKVPSDQVVDVRTAQLQLLQDLTAAGIDPKLFDLMLSSELDRTLKKQFGMAFFLATMFFTLLSFGVIVFNGIYHWGISDFAISALIVETPIQFIGLLYIIARNLFPQAGATLHGAARAHSVAEALKRPKRKIAAVEGTGENGA